MKKLLLLFGLLVSGSVAHAQDNPYREQFEAFKRTQREQFDTFRDQCNAEFAEFLKQSWKEFRTAPPVEAPWSPEPDEPTVAPVASPEPAGEPEPVDRPVAPRPEPAGESVPAQPEPSAPEPAAEKEPAALPIPKEEPVARPRPSEPVGEPEPVDRSVAPQPEPSEPEPFPDFVPDPVAEPDFNPVPEPAPVEPAVPAPEVRSGVDFDFFGSRVRIPWDEGLYFTLYSTGEGQVGEAWARLAGADCDPTLQEIDRLCDRWGLNDWGRYQLVKKLTEAAYDASHGDERVVAQAFLLGQMRYKTRMAAGDGRLYLLLPVEQQLYSTSYLTLDGGTAYYIMNDGQTVQSLSTYTRDFGYADRTFSILIDRPLMLGDEVVRQEMPAWSRLLGETVSVPLRPANEAFTLYYPLFELPLYHRCAVAPELERYVLDRVGAKIRGMGQRDAAAFILDLIQHGFDYQTDNEMFGRQKPLFIEESFYYGSNNCKDRVLLFTWLVDELLGLPVIRLAWDGNPGHVACGVCFTEEVEGDAYVWQGRRYVVCDPTYINAPVGDAMPQYVSIAPRIELP